MVYDIFLSSPTHPRVGPTTEIQRPPSPLLLPCQVLKFKCTLVSTVTRLAGHAHRLQMSLVLLNFLFSFCPVDVDATYSRYGHT